jgi:hypothetical protein
MGAEEWAYFVPYDPDIARALNKLRQQEFQAGRYRPATWDIEFLPGPGSAGPGAQHASIEEALEASGDGGTGSILDIHRVGEEPEDFEDGAVVSLADDIIRELFGTIHPSRDLILAKRDVLQGYEPGQGLYVVVYKGTEPSEIFFGGLSYD